MKIELDILNHVEQLRHNEAAALKGVSYITIWKLIKKGRFNMTENGLVINDERFKSYKARERKEPK